MQPQTQWVWCSSKWVPKLEANAKTEATATPRNQCFESQERCLQSEAPEKAATDLDAYESFQHLLKKVNWSEEELRPEALRAVQDASPSVQAKLVEGLEDWHAAGNLVWIGDPLQRSHFITNRLRETRGHDLTINCQRLGGGKTTEVDPILEQHGPNIAAIAAPFSAPYVPFLELLRKFNWLPEELHPEALKAVWNARPTIQEALVKNLEAWGQVVGFMNGHRDPLQRSRFLCNRLRKLGAQAPRILDEPTAVAASPGRTASAATPASTASAAAPSPLPYARFLSLMKSVNWSKEELHPDALQAVRKACRDVQLKLVEDMEARHEQRQLASIPGRQRSQFLCNRLHKLGAQAPRLEDKCVAALALRHAKQVAGPTPSPPKLAAATAPRPVKQAAAPVPSPAKQPAAPSGVEHFVGPLLEGRFISARVLLKRILGDDPYSSKALDPSHQITQQVDSTTLGRCLKIAAFVSGSSQASRPCWKCACLSPNHSWF